ncbi:MAG: methyltransferase domain-containing protein [Betaproteobacteria bacterium]
MPDSTQPGVRPTWYERHVLPRLMDIACGIGPVRRQRQRVVPLAEGNVLEIGIGTGLNLEFYDMTRVGKVVGLDPGLAPRLTRKRAKQAGLAVELVDRSAERIPYQDGTFDTVLVTYTLCSIADAGSALREMRRVLKAGGRLVFCEHGQAPDAAVRRWQDRLTPIWSKMAGGCHLNRDIPALLNEAGFRSTDMQCMYLTGPRPLTYNFWGTASAV